MFDTSAFMQTSVEGEMSTSIPSVPVGEFQAQISKIPEPEVKEDKEGNPIVLWNIVWKVLDQSVKDATKLENPTVRQTLWLDVNDKGVLDRSEGKNVGLGRLRDALGQNTGKAWSPSMLMGGMATIKVGHKPNQDNPENPYANVVSVAKAA